MPRAAYFFLIAADVAIAAATLQDVSGQFVFPGMSITGGEMLGVPAIVSGAVPEGSIYLIDASGIAADARTSNR
jgi:hypothetical protein